MSSPESHSGINFIIISSVSRNIIGKIQLELVSSTRNLRGELTFLIAFQVAKAALASTTHL